MSPKAIYTLQLPECTWTCTTQPIVLLVFLYNFSVCFSICQWCTSLCVFFAFQKLLKILLFVYIPTNLFSLLVGTWWFPWENFSCFVHPSCQSEKRKEECHIAKFKVGIDKVIMACKYQYSFCYFVKKKVLFIIGNWFNKFTGFKLTKSLLEQIQIFNCQNCSSKLMALLKKKKK